MYKLLIYFNFTTVVISIWYMWTVEQTDSLCFLLIMKYSVFFLCWNWLSVGQKSLIGYECN